MIPDKLKKLRDDISEATLQAKAERMEETGEDIDLDELVDAVEIGFDVACAELLPVIDELIKALENEKFLRERGCDLSPADWGAALDEAKLGTCAALAKAKEILE